MMKDIATLLLVDIRNLFHQAKNKGGKLDFEKIWAYFNGRETEFLTEAIMYLIRGESFDSSKFEAKMKSIGYSLRVKNTVRINTGSGKTIYKQTNLDILLVVDCLNRVNSFEKLILMSGDGGYADLCEDLKKKGKQIEIWSFQESFNPVLGTFADKVNFIEGEFFYREPKIGVFGLRGELP